MSRKTQRYSKEFKAEAVNIKKSNCRFNWSTQQLCENMGLRRFFE